MDSFANKNVTVMGLGRFAGGLAITRYLANQGASVLVTDLADESTLADSIAQLQPLIDAGKVQLRLGEHQVDDFTSADCIIANPAVAQPWNNQYLNAARDADIPITTEIEIALAHLDHSRLIAITGSAGKSTTAAMTHAALQAAGAHAILAGNIGSSILDVLDQLTDQTIIVLELSSAMLHWIDTLSPAVAVATNCTENHTDWHASFLHYRDCKQSIFTSQPDQATAVLDQSLTEWETNPGIKRIIISDDDRIADCTAPGIHNATNAAMASAAARAVLPDASVQKINAAIRAFPGLPHRLSLCHQLNSIRFFNDSKCTVPGATVLAIQALSQSAPASTIHLIAGGYDKGSDLAPISTLAESLAGLYTIGATGKALAANAKSNAHHCTTLQEAMQTIMQRMKPGDTVLLSPGCASWDQFTNYEHRGNTFRDLAIALTEHSPCG
ncbi:MAG: UDP-N-acetylmuramoyl-L-alanine--D-glutamate ligase [Phycisphaerales bacterium]|nr:UDP-N-acetylmuramoyl-L-alanine--D-glutamate ligase [Phycisphaerales bacterium]